MSQQGSARHASRRSSGSPVRDPTDPSLAPSHLGPRGGAGRGRGGQGGRGRGRGVRNDSFSDTPGARPENFPVNPEAAHESQVAPRTFGLHNMLNPSEPRQISSSGSMLPPPRSSDGESSAGGGTTQQHYGPRNSPYPFQAHPGPQSQSVAPGPPQPAETHSPRVTPSYAMGTSRRFLTPKSPRGPAALGRSSSIRSLDQSASYPPSPTTTLPPGPQNEASPLYSHPPPGMPGHRLPPHMGMASTLSTQVTPPRAVSQPVLSHMQPQKPQQSQPPPLPPIAAPVASAATHRGPNDSISPPHLQRTLSRSPVTTGPGYAPLTSASRLGTTSAHAPPGLEGQWPRMSGLPGHGAAGGSTIECGPLSAAKGLAVSAGLSGEPHHLLIRPPTGEEFVVPVDYHQASKQADEKRLRNAGASARFRARKKEKEREQHMGLQKLENTNRDLQQRVRELEVERDFYRDERNRLRDIISRTPGPGIAEASQGPPTPIFPRSTTGTLAEPPAMTLARTGPTRPDSRAGASTPPQGTPQMAHQALPPSPAHQQQPRLHHPPPFRSGDSERPTRRRRTGSQTEFSPIQASYHAPGPHGLPPMSYGIPPGPQAPPPSTTPPGPPGQPPRLPPLRGMGQPGIPSTEPPPPPYVGFVTDRPGPYDAWERGSGGGVKEEPPPR